MIGKIILIAFAANGLLLNPIYNWIITKLHIDKKPFNCAYCLSTWFSLIYSFLYYPLIWVLPITLATSFLTSSLSRYIDTLPIRIK